MKFCKHIFTTWLSFVKSYLLQHIFTILTLCLMVSLAKEPPLLIFTFYWSSLISFDVSNDPQWWFSITFIGIQWSSLVSIDHHFFLLSDLYFWFHDIQLEESIKVLKNTITDCSIKPKWHFDTLHIRIQSKAGHWMTFRQDSGAIQGTLLTWTASLEGPSLQMVSQE